MSRRMDDDWPEAGPMPIIGSAFAVDGDTDDEPVGRLLVPDPEQRRGWREHTVYRPSPQRRRIGFGRPSAVIRRGR